MIEIDKRHCLLGVYLNTPTQQHGEERVPAKVIGIKNVMLDKALFNLVLGDAEAWDTFFLEGPRKPPQPRFVERLGVLALGPKFKRSTVSLTFGLKPHEVAFTDATVKSVKLEPQEGGLTALSCTIVALKSNVRGELARLDEHLNTTASIALTLGDPEDEDDDDEDSTDDQPPLDLDHSKSAGGNGERRTHAGAREH